MNNAELEKQFYEAVMGDVKIISSKYGYNPKVFLGMISKHGAVETAKRLINSSKPSDGYTKLWEHNALQYSIENRIQDKKWYPLFSDDARMKAKKRLSDYGFQID